MEMQVCFACTTLFQGTFFFVHLAAGSSDRYKPKFRDIVDPVTSQMESAPFLPLSVRAAQDLYRNPFNIESFLRWILALFYTDCPAVESSIGSSQFQSFAVCAFTLLPPSLWPKWHELFAALRIVMGANSRTPLETLRFKDKALKELDHVDTRPEYRVVGFVKDKNFGGDSDSDEVLDDVEVSSQPLSHQDTSTYPIGDGNEKRYVSATESLTLLDSWINAWLRIADPSAGTPRSGLLQHDLRVLEKDYLGIWKFLLQTAAETKRAGKHKVLEGGTLSFRTYPEESGVVSQATNTISFNTRSFVASFLAHQHGVVWTQSEMLIDKNLFHGMLDSIRWTEICEFPTILASSAEAPVPSLLRDDRTIVIVIPYGDVVVFWPGSCDLTSC